MFQVGYAINRCCSAVFIIFRQLKAVYIFTGGYGLVTVEVLIILYVNFSCIEESAGADLLLEGSRKFQVLFIADIEFPFIEINIASENTIDPF